MGKPVWQRGASPTANVAICNKYTYLPPLYISPHLISLKVKWNIHHHLLSCPNSLLFEEHNDEEIIFNILLPFYFAQWRCRWCSCIVDFLRNCKPRTTDLYRLVLTLYANESFNKIASKYDNLIVVKYSSIFPTY